MINLILARRTISTTHSIWVIERPCAALRQWMVDTNFGDINSAAERSMQRWCVAEKWVSYRAVFFLYSFMGSWRAELDGRNQNVKPLNSTHFKLFFFFWGGEKARWSRAINGYDGFGIASDWTCYGWVAKEELGQPWRPRRLTRSFLDLGGWPWCWNLPWKTFPKNELRN